MERTYWSYSEEKSSVITAFVCLQMSASDIYFPSNNPCPALKIVHQRLLQKG